MESNRGNKTDQLAIKAWAFLVAALVALTWKLWFPGFCEFPRVPVANILSESVLSVVHYMGTATFLLGLFGLTVSWLADTRVPSLAIAIGFLICFLANQHCLQPWAWQAFIIAVLLFCFPSRDAKTWIARLLVSIYLYSAVGKLDFQFVHTTGLEFLEVILGWIGLSEEISGEWKTKLVLLLPIGELLIGMGMLVGKTRKLAAWMAVMLHLVLIVILSPLGLNHQWPVLVWNAQSILLVAWLFIASADGVSRTETAKTGTAASGLLFVFLILAGPLLRPLQLWDHWLAWGLYSPSNSRVEVFVARNATDSVGMPSDDFFSESTTRPGSVEFAIDRWSLDDVGVPIYPQARFQKAAAIRWLSDEGLTRYATIVEYGPSHPMTGRRNSRVLDPEETIESR